MWLDGIGSNDNRTTVNYTVNYQVGYSSGTLTVTIGYTDDNFDKTVGLVPQVFVGNGYKGNFSSNSWSSTDYSTGDELSIYFYFAYNGGASASSSFNYTVPSDAGSGDDPEPGSGGDDPEPAENPYCNLEIGHLASPSADANSFILLSVGSDGDGHTIVNIKQDNAKNSAMFDYINIVGKKETGTDVTTGGSDEMAIMFNTPTPDGDGNITFTLQWSTINWGGRWQIENITLPADATCDSADPFPGTNAYCKYTDNQMRSGNANVALTWSTDASGNVVIDISDGDGASGSAFRNGGFENEGTFANSWKVYSGTKHSVVESADTYFNAGVLSNGDKRFTLSKKANLPDNAVVAFMGHAFSWRTDQATGAYTLNKWFAYDYGYSCPFLAAPTNVAVDGTKHITFDGVANAQTYTVYVYLDGIVKHHQVVSSGDVLTFQPYTTGTYQVQVVADASGYPTSEPSEAYNWALTAPAIEVGNSEYCEYAIGSGNQAAAITWETTNEGNIVITLKETLGGDEDATQFRGDNGMDLANFQVGEAKTGAGAYFNHSKSGNTLTLSLKNSSIKPGLGEKIYFTDKVVEYVTSQNNNAYGYMTFEFTYGAKCSGQKHVSVAVNDNAMGSATVNGEAAVDVDENTQVTCVATPAEGYEFVNWTVGGVEVSTTATYQPTITAATSLVANFDYARTTYCHTAVQTNGNKKVYLTVGKGATDGTYQIKIEGSDELTITGINNANTAINRVKYLTYDGNDVPLNVANGGWTYSNEGYGVITSAEIRPQTGYTWRDMWMWRPDLYMGTSSGEQVINDILDNQHHFNWDNDCSDTEAPEWITCSAAALTTTSVRLTLQASDNWGGTLTYTIARAGEDDIEKEGVSGEIVTRDFTELTTGTEYTFDVSVSDGVNTTAALSLTVTPSGDSQAPVITAFTATPSYGYVDLSVTATDDVAGDLTYSIVYGETEESVVGAAGSEVTKRIYTLPNTNLSFRVTATDAAEHVSVPAVANARTLTIPTSPAPVHNEDLVYSVYSDKYAPAVASTFNLTNWGSANAIAQTDYLLYRMNANVIVWGNNDGNAGHGNIDGLDGYTYGSNPGLDVSQMQYLHFDVWCDVAGQLNTVNINDQTISIPTTRTIAGEWVSFDVAIDGVNEADRQNLRWMKFHPFNTSNCHVAIDNVYFWNYGVKTTSDEDGYGWASFASAEKVKFSADITGYFAEYQNNGDGEVLLLHEITDRIIPAGEGVLLRGTGNAAFAFSTTDETPATDFTNNTLEGCTERTDISDLHANYDIFCLRRSDLYEMSGFFLYTGQYIPAGKAYLKLAKDPAVPASSRRVRFVFDQENTATGVDNAENVVKVSKCIENGQLYIIRDGIRYTATGLRVE